MLMTSKSAGEDLLSNHHWPGTVLSEGCFNFRCSLHCSKTAYLYIDVVSGGWWSVVGGLKGRGGMERKETLASSSSATQCAAHV